MLSSGSGLLSTVRLCPRRPLSAEPGQVMSQLSPPGWPVVRHIGSPQVQFVRNLPPGQQGGEMPGASQRAGRVLPLALAADQQQTDPLPEPVQVLAAQVNDVVDRVVEVGRQAALPPAIPG